MTDDPLLDILRREVAAANKRTDEAIAALQKERAAHAETRKELKRWKGGHHGERDS